MTDHTILMEDLISKLNPSLMEYWVKEFEKLDGMCVSQMTDLQKQLTCAFTIRRIRVDKEATIHRDISPFTTMELQAIKHYTQVVIPVPVVNIIEDVELTYHAPGVPSGYLMHDVLTTLGTEKFISPYSYSDRPVYRLWRSPKSWTIPKTCSIFEKEPPFADTDMKLMRTLITLNISPKKSYRLSNFPEPVQNAIVELGYLENNHYQINNANVENDVITEYPFSEYPRFGYSTKSPKDEITKEEVHETVAILNYFAERPTYAPKWVLQTFALPNADELVPLFAFKVAIPNTGMKLHFTETRESPLNSTALAYAVYARRGLNIEFTSRNAKCC